MKKSFVLSMLALFIMTSHAQLIKSKLDVVGGASAREYYHLGIRYQYAENFQLGLYCGSSLGINSKTITTYSVNNLFHFGSNSFYSNRLVWYGRLGFTYAKDHMGNELHSYSFINMGLGREFNISEKVGFNVDGGLIIQTREKTEWSSGLTPIKVNKTWFYLPLVRAQVYFSF